MKFLIKSLKNLTKFEIFLWIISVIIVIISYIFSNNGVFNLIVSLIGITALLFISKGNPLGNFLDIIFSILYIITSFYSSYFGETIVYLFLNLPFAVLTLIKWKKNLNKETEVKISPISKYKIIELTIFSFAISLFFVPILKILDGKMIFISVFSIFSSLMGMILLYFRSKEYALFYIANDISIILLWSIDSYYNLKSLPMIFCFVMFLINDIYGYINWKKLIKEQENGKNI